MIGLASQPPPFQSDYTTILLSFLRYVSGSLYRLPAPKISMAFQPSETRVHPRILIFTLWVQADFPTFSLVVP